MELDFGLDAGHARGRLGFDEIEADAIVFVANLSDSDAPTTFVRIVDGHRGADHAGLAFQEFGALDVVWCELVEFEIPKQVPNELNWSADASAFLLSAACGDLVFLSFEH